MVKSVIVMRHGKAKAPVQDQEDIERCLSKAGIQSLVAQLPSMLRPLDEDCGLAEIWTSPAQRTKQTAKLLRNALKEQGIRLKKAQEYDCLWEQDIDKFIAELAASEVDTVFAVCHAPFVEDVVQQLVGTTPPFSTGAIACLSVSFDSSPTQDEPTMPSSGRLLWFSQGPDSHRWKTLVEMQKAISASANEVEQRRAAFLDDPKDIETMHKFRVSIRTLRSLIAFIKPWQQASQNAQTQEFLKEIVGYTSRLRELDVFEAQARANESSSPEFLAFCEHEASTERKRVQKAITSKRLTKKLSKALSEARNIVWKKDVLANGLAQDDVRREFDATVASIEADLANLRLADEERTHDVRKYAKRVRYAAERFDAILGEDAVGIAKGMVAHQDNLGAVCDAHVNIALIHEFLQRDLPDPVVWDLTLLRAQNETFLFQALKAEEAEASAQEALDADDVEPSADAAPELEASDKEEAPQVIPEDDAEDAEPLAQQTSDTEPEE